jgi:hypothetical protein
MKRTFALLGATITCIFITNTMTSQAPAIEWSKCYGGSSSEELHAIYPTSDGGYIMGGQTQSADGDVTNQLGWSDCWVVKIAANGAIQWQKSYGSAEWEVLYDIKPTTGGGYVFVGRSTSNQGDLTSNYGSDDVWVVKLNNSGNIQWQRSYGGSSHEDPRCIIQTSDGGYAVSGYSWSSNHDVDSNQGQGDMWILKINSTGNIQWKKSFGSTEYDEAYMIEQTSDGGYIVAGYAGAANGDVTGHHGGMDAWAIKLNSSGNVEWKKCYGGTSDEWFSSVKQTPDGGFIFFGDTESEDGDVSSVNGSSDMWLVKTNSTGNIQWEKTFGGSSYEEGAYLSLTNDGGYIVTGYTASNDMDVTGNHGDIDYWVVKLSSSGNIQWQKCMGGPEEDEGYAVIQTADNGYMVLGYSNSDGGDVTGGHGDYDAWLVKLSGTVGMDEEQTTLINTTSIYPNPASTHITLSNITRGAVISIHDSNGKLMHQAVVNDTQATINTAQYASGVYMVQVKHNNTKETHRLVID